MAVSIPIAGPLRPARFVDRPNRFIVRARLEPSHDVVSAHLPDPGRLQDLLVPDAPLWLRAAEGGGRRTEWSALLVQSPDGSGLVSLDTLAPNRVVASAIEAEAIEELEGWHVERKEAQIGRSRFDFLLSSMAGEQMVVEVKGVTWVEGGVGRFPDAPTTRGTRHLEGLIDLASQPGWSATLMFVVQRIDATQVTAAPEIDPDFARALAEAHRAGVRLLARRCQVTLQELVLGKAIPVVL